MSLKESGSQHTHDTYSIRSLFEKAFLHKIPGTVGAFSLIDDPKAQDRLFLAATLLYQATYSPIIESMRRKSPQKCQRDCSRGLFGAYVFGRKELNLSPDEARNIAFAAHVIRCEALAQCGGRCVDDHRLDKITELNMLVLCRQMVEDGDAGLSMREFYHSYKNKCLPNS